MIVASLKKKTRALCDRVVADLRDMSAELAVLEPDDASLKAKRVRVDEAIDTMQNFLSTMRTSIVHLDKVSIDSCTEKHVIESEALSSTAETHLDGARNLLKKVKTLLTT